ncbi:hypothetical protein [Bifidobacterium callimiconis]|uniref:hypothetical protein n=1 Tax=Bifidobacterium callimiconis TaxID=2306973 RepID=UPI0013E02969|nr:hypothetical protein [Bifidobacterium callimiconis]
MSRMLRGSRFAVAADVGEVAGVPFVIVPVGGWVPIGDVPFDGGVDCHEGVAAGVVGVDFSGRPHPTQNFSPSFAFVPQYLQNMGASSFIDRLSPVYSPVEDQRMGLIA